MQDMDIPVWDDDGNRRELRPSDVPPHIRERLFGDSTDSDGVESDDDTIYVNVPESVSRPTKSDARAIDHDGTNDDDSDGKDASQRMIDNLLGNVEDSDDGHPRKNENGNFDLREETV